MKISRNLLEETSSGVYFLNNPVGVEVFGGFELRSHRFCSNGLNFTFGKFRSWFVAITKNSKGN